jgi:hypothetical protein
VTQISTSLSRVIAGMMMAAGCSARAGGGGGGGGGFISDDGSVITAPDSPVIPSHDAGTMQDIVTMQRDTGVPAIDVRTTMDPCLDASDCATCTLRSVCGWCGASGRCAQGTGSGPLAGSCAGSWAWASSMCSMTTDPRPPEERACPSGGTLRVQLWQVFATPRRPDGAPWDGVTAGTRELLCEAAASFVRGQVESRLNMWTPGAGTAFDWFVGESFQQGVANACGVAGNWLQMRFEGPDIFASGIRGAAVTWNTTAIQDSFRAPNVGGTWTNAEWRGPCRSSTQIQFSATDEDLAFDDPVETSPAVTFANIRPAAICSGWAWLPGAMGLIGTLFRLEVQGATPSCAGISAASFEDFVIRTSRGGSIPSETRGNHVAD